MRRGREHSVAHRVASSSCLSGTRYCNTTPVLALPQLETTRLQVNVHRLSRSTKRHYAYLTSQVSGDSTNKNAIRRPSGFWTDQSNQREFLESIASQLGVNQLSDWYQVTRSKVIEQGGVPLFRKYSSLYEALKTLYPDYPWEPKRFSDSAGKFPAGYWLSVTNQRQFLQTVGKELGVAELSDWYKISRQDVEKKGGARLFTLYSSLPEALQSLFPDHPWDANQFKAIRSPNGFWKAKENLMIALERVEQQLGIRRPEDWYSVNLSDMRQLGFPSSVGRLELVQLLSEKYPNYQWERVYLLRGRFAQQNRLERAVASIFPELELKINVRKEAGLLNPATGAYLELDIWIPSLNIAFEYQDIHHYLNQREAYTPIEVYQQRDKVKKELAEEKGIYLFLIPCWWDGRKESLLATIRKQRPDLVTSVQGGENEEGISSEMPEGFSKQHSVQIEGVGEPITACFLTQTSTDPTNWWMFEKYDGIRGFWNPVNRKMYSRYGKAFELPDEVMNSMPNDIYIDGELWFGREGFQESTKIAHRAPYHMIDWSRFRYMVWDVPNNPASYRERYSMLEKHLEGYKSKFVELAPKIECKGSAHMEEYFHDIIEHGGEGIILRDPSAPYKAGRSTGYLKHKKFRDAEARIVAASGPHQWLCELPNGVSFTATPGTHEFVKRWNPKPGDIVSFKHAGFLISSKKPKLPSLYRVRPDLTWETVVANWKEHTPTINALPFRRPVRTDLRPKGHWNSRENRRQLFCDFAASMGFDPMIPDNWKNADSEALHKQASAFLSQHFGGSVHKALQDAFPELDFDAYDGKRFKHYWKDINHCRLFFDAFAREKGFDPLDPTKWYSVTPVEFFAKRRASQIATSHGGFKRALLKAYPEVNFTRWKDLLDEAHWTASADNVRRWFDEFARDQGFDPSRAESWDAVKHKDMLAFSGGPSLHHRIGFERALQMAYPDLPFKFTKK